MEPTKSPARRVQWRLLTTGALVWAPVGKHGWRAALVTGLGKNRGDNTVVQLAFDTGGQGRRLAGELFWRKPELRGQDKPSTNDELELTQSGVKKVSRRRGRIIDLTTQHKGQALSIVGAPVVPGTFKQGRLFN
jgi:hypothetical protein